MLLLLLTAQASPEICDGINNDGEGGVDEAPLIVFADLDQDGHGDPGSPIVQTDCVLTGFEAATGDDCDDSSHAVHADAAEICDGLDNDCDGEIDETGCTDCDHYTRNDSTYQGCTPLDSWDDARERCRDIGYDLVVVDDADENNFLRNHTGNYDYLNIGLADADSNNSFTWVDGTPLTYENWQNHQPNGNNQDCVYLSMSSGRWNDWACGQDDDDTISMCEVECTRTAWYDDGDGDGFGGTFHSNACVQPVDTVANNTDCNDAAPLIHPTATEICNGDVDDDCNPATSEPPTHTLYLDSDNDSFGDDAVSISSCGPTAGYVADNTDCDDDDDAVGGPSLRYTDVDGDSFGANTPGVIVCPEAGNAALAGDCDDNNVHVFPGQTEVCNHIDDDCYAGIDNGLTFFDTYPDADGDSYGEAGATAVEACDAPVGWVLNDTDCNDGNAHVNPGAVEACNHIDDDCHGGIDDGLTFVDYFPDTDGDSFGAAGASATSTCDGPPPHAVPNDADCDDGDAHVNPDEDEICNEVDDDCHGGIDDGLAVFTHYPDFDGDGFGTVPGFDSCNLDEPNATSLPGDCLDSGTNAAAVNPDAMEICNGIDDDCANGVDDGLHLTTYYTDGDADGYGDEAVHSCETSPPGGTAAAAGDCDDVDPHVNPGEVEACNGIDDDCVGGVDDGLAPFTYYVDHDDDGYGAEAVVVCDASSPHGTVTAHGDCDDADPHVNPGEVEICNSIDDDCVGGIDDGLPGLTYYPDNDSDGWGEGVGQTFCNSTPPDGFVAQTGDCDGNDPHVSPGELEVCDGVDQDCDHLIDDGLPEFTYYEDSDNDTFGGPNQIVRCENTVPVGYSNNNADCDDSASGIFPGAPELCDPEDRNCDGDPVLGATDTNRYFLDSDEDTYGDAAITLDACVPLPLYVLDHTDCDDALDTVNPGEDEVCDGLDNDCDHDIDEDAIDALTFFEDGDGDGFGTAVDTQACARPDGFANTSGDCVDSNPNIFPAASEQCDGLDNDCDHEVDEDVVFQDFFRDLDGDGFGTDADVVNDCQTQHGYVLTDSDCDDNGPHAAEINPNAIEICNGRDDNCVDGEEDTTDGTVVYTDADGDGFGVAGSSEVVCESAPNQSEVAGDCEDTGVGAVHIFPGAIEVCDGMDNDCDQVVDLDADTVPQWRQDHDNDGYGTDITIGACVAPPGYALVPSGDCNDTEPTVNPGQIEVCDSLDNDCNQLIDADDPGLADFLPTFYADADGDGFGDADVSIEACLQPGDYVVDSTDCEDGQSTVYPGAPELCDGIDNDCDGQVEALDAYVDDDLDGFGDPDRPACAGSDDGTDCDDSDETVNPAGTEICGDTVDQDCDGVDLECEEEQVELVDTGCRCSASPGLGPVGLGTLALLTMFRRRR